MAGLNAGVWSGIEELKREISEGVTFAPKMDEERRYSLLLGLGRKHSENKAQIVFEISLLNYVKQ